MAETYKFPGGYDVAIFKKQDIIDCIDKNIVDKEVALAIIEQCELDASNFLREGRWTGIPFIGNIRIPKGRVMESTVEQQELIQGARENLELDKYVLFRKQLGQENARHIRLERYYRYITSIAVCRNRQLYRKLCDEKGEYYARIFLYASKSVTAVDNEYVTLDDYEQ